MRRAAWACLLRAFPREFRDRFGEELLDALRLAGSEAEGGRLAAIRSWAALLADLLAAALRLRLQPPGGGEPARASEAGRGLRGRNGKATMGSLGFDLQQAWRGLARSPGVPVLIVGMLALGIGLSTAVFSVVEGVLLRPLPYPQPDRLVEVSAAYTRDGVGRTPLSGGTYRAIVENVSAFESAAAITSIRQNLAGTASPIQVQVGWASRNLFDLLGVRPLLGAGFTKDAPAGTLVLGHALWRSAFGGDEAVLGRTLRLDGRAYTIAGVLPPSFRLHLRSFPAEIDVYKVPDDWWQNGDLWGTDSPEFGILRVVGRLAPGRSVEQASDQLEALSARLQDAKVVWARVGLLLEAAPLHEAVVGGSRQTLTLLSGAVGLVLLIACANVASLLLLRSEARRREIALRMALGAGRARIVGFLFAESAWLAALGGGLGVALGLLATRLLSRLPISGLPRAGEVSLDASALAFALAASLVSTLLFGLAPAWRAARRDPAGELQGGRATADASRLRANQALVVGQLAVSLVLLVGAGLLVSSLVKLHRVDPGFDPKGALTFSVSAPGTRYERPHGTDRFFRALEERVRQLPGVRAVGIVWPLPLSRRVWSNLYSAGVVAEAERAYAEYRLATEGYFDTAGIRLLEGRLFQPGDRAGVVVVSRKLAERAWPGGPAVGQKLRALPWGPPEEVFEVVGVVEDVRNASLRERAAETLYFDSRGWSWTDWEVSYVVRGSVPPETLVPAVRAELARLDAEVPLAEVRPLSELVDDQLASHRFALVLLGVFAGAAVSLALAGLYGVVSYSVSRRRREVGIRVALGAGRGRILALVLGQGARLAAAGVAIGLVAASALTRLLGGLLYEVTPFEPRVVIGVAAGLALLAVGAAVGPARRAACVDPATTLRAE